MLIRLPTATAKLLADVALARSVTHHGETTLSAVIEDLVEQRRLQLGQEAQIVRKKQPS